MPRTYLPTMPQLNENTFDYFAPFGQLSDITPDHIVPTIAHIFEWFCKRNIRTYIDGYACKPLDRLFVDFETFAARIQLRFPGLSLHDIYDGPFYCHNTGNVITFFYTLIFDTEFTAIQHEQHSPTTILSIQGIQGLFLDDYIVNTCLNKMYHLVSTYSVSVSDVAWLTQCPGTTENPNMCQHLRKALGLLAKHGHNVFKVQRDLLAVKRMRDQRNGKRRRRLQTQQAVAALEPFDLDAEIARVVAATFT